MADARKDRRTLLSVKIRYKSATLEDFIERYSMDISRGGVFIKAKKPLAVGTLLKFEFVLQDQSILIHGVGRVAWRREEHEADASNPAGMGIKFIKMDPESRSIVERIAEKRGLPGVFDRGKEGVLVASSSMPSEPGLEAADATKVRHVSEFLATAMEEGGAGDAAIQAARVGAQRARATSNRPGAARGAFSATGDAAGRSRHGMSDSAGRGAMSAFGGASMGSSAGFRSSAAPAMDDFDDDDDFLDNETTKVQELPSASEFPDAAATVIASETPFASERRQTPLVPASTAPSSPLEQAVPDLFGPDSFGPAPGELIDASLLDPAVVTVPPKASALPRSAVPDAPGIAPEAFRVPQAPTPVGTQRPAPEKRSRVGLSLALLFVLLLLGGAVAAWQLGLTDDLMKLAAPYLGGIVGETSQVASAPKPAPTPVVAEPAATPDRAMAGEKASPEGVTDEPATDVDAQVDAQKGPVEGGAAAKTGTSGLVKMKVVSVPTGAFVSVNGKAAGRTPLALEYEAGESLNVFSKVRGFLPHREQVVVDPAQRELKMVLSPLPWVVEVVTEPAGASATAVGGGQVTTPGDLSFRSMPRSRDIVISKDGYKTVTKGISRGLFVEERTRMVASVRVTLAKDGPSAPSEAEPANEPAAAPKAVATEPAAEAAPEPPPAPKPAPSEAAPATETPSPDDAP